MAKKRTVGRLTEEQFTLAMQRLPQINPIERDIAHRVLVKREAQAMLARELQMAGSSVNYIVSRVYHAAIDNMQCPAGWVSLSVCVPRHLAANLKEIEATAKLHFMEQKSQLDQLKEQMVAEHDPD